MNVRYKPHQGDDLKDISGIKCLLIVVAMESEEKALLDEYTFEEITLSNKKNINIKKVSLPSCDILIGRSGVGLVNAGVLFTLVTEKYHIDAIIQTGVGGALHEDLNIGDIVVSRNVIQHDSICSNNDKNLLMAPGELFHSNSDGIQVDPLFKSDNTLKDWVVSTLSSTFIDKIHEGTILSGSEFAGSKKSKEEIASLDKDALLVDMESSAVAQLARKESIAFVSVKVVADRLVPKTSIEDDYKTFLDTANKNNKLIMNALSAQFCSK